MSRMLTVHHLNNSRSQRVLWLLEELGLEYDVKYYTRDPKTGRAPESLKLVHPLGKAPVLTDGDKNIAETGAIIEYLIQHYGQGRMIPKPDTQDYEDYTYFLHYGEGSAILPQLLSLYMSFLGDAGAPLQPLIAQRMKDHFNFIEYHLTGHKYFAGNELTGADIQMIFLLETAKRHGRLKNYEACAEFVDRMHQRPAYLRALEKGGSYEYGP